MATSLIFAVLAHWLVTMYVVEAEVLRPLRERLSGQQRVCSDYLNVEDAWAPLRPCKRHERGYTMVRRPKIKYLLSCRMCSGFWVALIFGLATGLNPLVVASLSHWLFITQRIAERLARSR